MGLKLLGGKIRTDKMTLQACLLVEINKLGQQRIAVAKWIRTAHDDALLMMRTVLEPLAHLQHDESRGRSIGCAEERHKSQFLSRVTKHFPILSCAAETLC
jgi:hypothetical protein